MTNKTELLPCPFCNSSVMPGVSWAQCSNSLCVAFHIQSSDFRGWNTRVAPAEDVRAVVDEPVLPELTSDLREILGRPNFTCHFIAKALRLMGFDIPHKSEEEQAVTIYWMLGHYIRDPVNWRDAASAELKASMPEPPAQQ